MYLLILDSLGNTELLLILVAALIFFGPRRLPQLSRQLGKSLSEFRRASEDFKRTWEREVNCGNSRARHRSREFISRQRHQPDSRRTRSRRA